MPYKDPQKARDHQRKYDAEHREEKREYNRKYQAEHREEGREYQRKYDEGHREEGREYQRKLREENPKLCMVRNARNRAQGKGLPFDLTAADFDIPERCPVLGLVLAPGIGKLAPSSPTLDRIDSTKGYVRGNVQVISWRANRLKSDGTAAEFRAIADNMEMFS